MRHIESVVRMAEASAKMHLRDYVRDDDVDLAIKVTLQSFLQAQKMSVRTALQSKFKQYLTYREENDRLLLHQLVNLMNDAEKFQVSALSILCAGISFVCNFSLFLSLSL